MTQPHSINQILTALNMNTSDTNTKPTPGLSTILKFNHAGKPFDNSFKYDLVIGMIQYLEKASRLDILYVTHQCARFTKRPKRNHGDAVQWIGRYLHGTKNKGTILKPDVSRGL